MFRVEGVRIRNLGCTVVLVRDFTVWLVWVGTGRRV